MTETSTATGRLPSEEDFAAALDWWREAGVDYDFSDDVTEWLAPLVAAEPARPPSDTPSSPATAAPPPRQAPPPPVENISPVLFGGEEGGWPTDLDGFAQWWLRHPSLEIGGTGPRIAPRGLARAELMIVVDHPEELDQDRLLSGQEGALLAGFLRAAGIAPDKAYFASLLPRFTPAPDWPQIAASGCGAVLAHHIGLVLPEQILFLGRNILPLLGHGVAQDGKTLRCFNHKGRSFPYVEGQGLARMLRSAALRRNLWQSWLDGTDG